MAVRDKENIVVVGLGEVGRPLLELLSKHYKVVGLDIAPSSGPIDQAGQA
jgi:UDP-N-acetyl-D-mannosaminuronate dehydrogenase